MAFSFGDSFDLYTSGADMVGYWDSFTGGAALGAGRFAGSRYLNPSSSLVLPKTSGVNDPVHHLVFGYVQTQPVSGASLWQNFQLFDGATAQCSVVLRSDGAIVLTSGGPGGTVLATYVGAFSLINTWYAFEVEIVIHPTAGSFAVRKNGNAVNDFSATGLNTRPTSTNSYANKLVIGSGGNSIGGIDDLFWQSGAATGAWLGDLRCLTRLPVSDQSVQFSKAPTSPVPQTPFAANGTTNSSATSAWYTPVVAAYDATLGSLTVSINAGFTGNLKCTLFTDTGSGPGAIIASPPTLTNPVTGNNTLTFGSPPTLARGVKYWIGFSADGVYTNAYNIATNQGFGSSTTYAAFPVVNPVSSGFAPAIVITLSLTIGNHSLVADPQQDGTASYVYDSNPGDQDFYGITPGANFTSTPYSTVAVISRAFMQKGDAGTRTAAVKVKSGATTVATPTVPLSNTVWQWAWRQDLTDPNTGAAWTGAAVDALQLGPTVVA